MVLSILTSIPVQPRWFACLTRSCAAHSHAHPTLAQPSSLAAWEVEFDEYDNPDDVGYLRKDVGAQQSFAECEIDAVSEEGSERYFMHQPGDLNYDDVESVEGGEATPASPLSPASAHNNGNNGATGGSSSSGHPTSLATAGGPAHDSSHGGTPSRMVLVTSSTGVSTDASPSTSALSSPVGGGSGPSKSRKQQLLFGGGIGRRNTASALGTGRDATGARLALAINKLPSADASWDAGPTDIKFGVPVITPSKAHDHSEPRPVLSRVESLSSSFKDFDLERMGHDEDGGTTSRSQNNGQAASSEAGYDSEAEVIDFQVSGSNLADGGYRDQDLSSFFIPNSHNCTRASSITSSGLEGYHVASGSGSTPPVLALDTVFAMPDLLAGEAVDFNVSLSAAPTANHSASAYSTSSANVSSSSGVHPWPLGYATTGVPGSRSGSGEASPAAAGDSCSARVTWCGVGAANTTGGVSAAQQERKSHSGEASAPTLAGRAASGGQLFDGASIFSGGSLLTSMRGGNLPTSSSSVPTTPKLSLPAFMIGASSPAIHSARCVGSLRAAAFRSAFQEITLVWSNTIP